jgi:adenosylcobinamide kinase/adenosylcobinamide-phosphate guanylyltransferase
MRLRIDRHRHDRPPSWRTLEATRAVGSALRQDAGSECVVLLDCVTLLVSNLVLTFDDPFSASAERGIDREVAELIRFVDERDGYTIVVSNEVGLGVVPAHELGRAYRDLLGRANQILAQRADQVYFLVSGVPLLIKQA